LARANHAAAQIVAIQLHTLTTGPVTCRQQAHHHFNQPH